MNISDDVAELIPEHTISVMDPLFQQLEQKIEMIRCTTELLSQKVYQSEISLLNAENRNTNQIHTNQLDVREVESNLNYLSHKTQLQLKEMENVLEKIRHELSEQIKELQFRYKEQVANLNRRVENLEKLLL